MADYFAKMSVLLTGNAEPLAGAVTQATRLFTGLAGAIAPAFEKATSQVGTILQKLASGNVTGALGSALKAVKDQAWGFVGSFKAGISELLSADAEARRLNVSILDLRAAMHYAGSSGEEMTAALEHVRDRFTLLSVGSAQARRDLMGLAELSGQSFEQLARGGSLNVLDALAAIPDEAQRAGQAFLQLGNSAGAFIDRLSRGGPAAAKDLMTRLGLGVTPGEVAAAREVATTIREIEAVGKGIYNQFLLAVAPIVSELSKLFSGIKVDLNFIKPLVLDITEGVAKFGAFLIEASTNSKLLTDAIDYGWKQAERGFLNFKAVVLQGLADIADAMVPLSVRAATLYGSTYLGGAKNTITFGEVTDHIRAAAAQARAEAGAIGTSSAGQWGSIMAALGASPVYQAVAGFFGRVRQAGMPGPPGTASGAVPAYLAQQFGSMAGGLASPGDVFAQKMAELSAMERYGLFAGRPGLRGLAAFQAAQALFSATGMGEARLAGVAEAQSREAYSTLAHFETEGQRGGLQQRIEAALQAANVQRDKMIQQGQEIIRAVQRTAENTDADSVGSEFGGGWD